MVWNEATRERYRRDEGRCASDLSAAEWRVLGPLLPPPSVRGRRRRTPLRRIVNALLYLLWSGCPWRGLPRGFSPFTTVQYHFYRWRDQGWWPRINALLVARSRMLEGRDPEPSAVVIDSQSARTTESGGPRGFDAAKKVKGRKRHIATDTSGRLIETRITPANVQDCHGAVPLLKALAARFPGLRHAYADRAYRGNKLLDAVADPRPWTIEIITRSQRVGHFVQEPRRWVVERTFAWLGRNRRLAKDYEASQQSQEAWWNLASVKTLTRQIARTQ
ncbi:IS5 family transposase [Sphingomonas sp. SAFR-052]|uniref:IS5 family transposase n=1 Tax=Sphingomonas sp. SAFR-052 TaxID=3436867 RepID=UPI003F80A68B